MRLIFEENVEGHFTQKPSANKDHERFESFQRRMHMCGTMLLSQWWEQNRVLIESRKEVRRSSFAVPSSFVLAIFDPRFASWQFSDPIQSVHLHRQGNTRTSFTSSSRNSIHTQITQTHLPNIVNLPDQKKKNCHRDGNISFSMIFICT